jgi:hypothetical protein
MENVVLYTEWPTFLYHAKATCVQDATVNLGDAGNLYSSCSIVKLVESSTLYWAEVKDIQTSSGNIVCKLVAWKTSKQITR